MAVKLYEFVLIYVTRRHPPNATTTISPSQSQLVYTRLDRAILIYATNHPPPPPRIHFKASTSPYKAPLQSVRWYVSNRLLTGLVEAILRGFPLLIYILRFYIYRCTVI